MSVAKVNCELCGQEISKSNYSKHLRRHQNHPESFNKISYSLTHDGLNCQYCGKLCKSRNSLCNHERLCSQNTNRQILNNAWTYSDGRTAWNKGLTKESDERVLKQSQSQIGRTGKKGIENASSRPEVRKKISETCLKLSREGKWHTSLAKQHHIEYKGQDFHSTWEVEFAKFLDSKNVIWERTRDRFPYTYQEKQHYYTPDFYIKGYDTYIEIKGYRTGKDYAKWKQFPTNKTLKVLYGKDLIKLGIPIKL